VSLEVPILAVTFMGNSGMDRSAVSLSLCPNDSEGILKRNRKNAMKCKCKDTLKLVRTWRRTIWRCPGCGSEYPLNQFMYLLDDDMLELLGNVQVDRL